MKMQKLWLQISRLKADFTITVQCTIFKWIRSALNKFKRELPIMSDQALNFAFTKANNGGSCR